MVVLPAPVPPTKAIFCPGFVLMSMSKSTCLALVYPKSTSLKSTSPFASFSSTFPSSTSGSASPNANTRSAPTEAFSTELICWLTCEIGRVKLLLSCRKATTVPSVTIPSDPLMARVAPTTARHTNPKLLIPPFTGITILAMRLALQAEARSCSLMSSNALMACSS